MKPLVIYQLYARNFTNQGTLAAAEKMVPHLADLGIDAVYLSAINKADDQKEGQSPRQIASGMNNPKNPYRIVDYYAVDEEYGTIEDLKSFVKACHKANIKVLIDLVYMHCGPNAVFIKDHPNFIKRNEKGEMMLTPYGFLLIDFDDEELREYLWSNMEYYIKEIDADGFRCDVAEEVPLDFWKEGFRRVKKIKPDLIFLDEGGMSEYLEAFDLLYGGGVEGAINRTFIHKNNAGKSHKVKTYHFIPLDKETVYNAEHIKNAWMNTHKKAPLASTINNAENHDIANDAYDERLDSHLGPDAGEAILAFLFTLDGIPMIYNGNEFADSGRRSMFWNRFCQGNMSLDWSNLATEVGKKRLQVVKNLIRFRKNRKSLTCGDLVWADHSGSKTVLGFSRHFENETTHVFINTTAKVQKTKLQNIQPGKVLASNNATIDKNTITLLPYGYVITE